MTTLAYIRGASALSEYRAFEFLELYELGKTRHQGPLRPPS